MDKNPPAHKQATFLENITTFNSPLLYLYVAQRYNNRLLNYALSRSHILINFFAKSGTEVKTPESKNEFIGDQHAPPLPLFCLSIEAAGPHLTQCRLG